jgi:hypothetical protein
MDMTKFGSEDSAGYIKVLKELRRFIKSAASADMRDKNVSQGSEGLNTGEKQAPSSRGGINFYGPITGDKVIAGTQTTQGGTTNFTFN